jgi:2,3-bisphosphoglycerate-dependent phosphoglycerate mutase
MRTDVVLVRHAESVARTADGPDEFRRPLTPPGLVAAEELAEVLCGMHPAAVWSSPYRRAIQTVEPAARALGLDVQTRWELREWDDGLAFTDAWVPHYEQSWSDPSFARAGGESLDQLTRRAVDALRVLAARYRGERVLVASHGTFISRALCGFGVAVSWPLPLTMPTPALYRLHFGEHGEQPRCDV